MEEVDEDTPQALASTDAVREWLTNRKGKRPAK